jgi:hypothetical protein
MDFNAEKSCGTLLRINDSGTFAEPLTNVQMAAFRYGKLKCSIRQMNRLRTAFVSQSVKRKSS